MGETVSQKQRKADTLNSVRETTRKTQRLIRGEQATVGGMPAFNFRVNAESEAGSFDRIRRWQA